MNETLVELAKDYIKLLQSAMAIRAKSAPTRRMEYDPLTDAMTKLAMCLRKQDTTEQQFIEAVNFASARWQEWHDKHTQFWEHVGREGQDAVDGGDTLAVMNVLRFKAKG